MSASKLPFKVIPKTNSASAAGTKTEIKLLPPMALYRRILRSHRQLPSFQRDLGDKYVKAEFRLHRSLDNPVQIIGFLTEWQKYLIFVNKNTQNDWKQYRMDETKLSKMTDDQIIQLHGLLTETKELFKEGAEEAKQE